MDKINYNNLDDITKLLYNFVYKKKKEYKQFEKKKPTYKFEQKNNKNLVNMQEILKNRRNIIPYFKQ